MINDIESGVWPGVCMTRKVAPLDVESVSCSLIFHHPVLAEGEEGGLVDWDQLFIKENFSNVKDVPKVIWLADGQKIRLHDTSPSARTGW
jgi:hypothetical protein